MARYLLLAPTLKQCSIVLTSGGTKRSIYRANGSAVIALTPKVAVLQQNVYSECTQDDKIP